jgi:hypothetical protein
VAAVNDGAVWAITCYFNPVGYRRRLETYRLFRERLAVPLATVELSFDGRFQLGPGDADALRQIHGGDVIWQKERLLNLALSLLPAACDKVAWLDCDVVFTDPDWPARANRALDEVLLPHLFQDRYDLGRDERLEPVDPEASAAPSMVYKMLVERVPPGDLLVPHPTRKRTVSQGLAWASRRDVLEAHGLYDACIVGSADRAMLCAALGTFHYGVEALAMNPRQEAHYLAWARPYFEAVGGRIGHIPGRALHLWHGEMQDRPYGARDRALASLDYDPARDIALDASGCWRWSSDKPELHAFVEGYFASRKEDGS